MGRLLGILFGLATHVIFAVTVWFLVAFLYGGKGSGRGLGWDALLALQFSVSHSFLLLPWTRKQWERVLPGELYGCFFCLVTCVSLLLTFTCWQPSQSVVWQLHGTGRALVTTGFVASWGALLYSLHLTGLGYQTGWTPFWWWVRGCKPPPRRFDPRGAYRYLRHPVYLSFLGLIWFTPNMTLDHAFLTVIWTGYIFIGSFLKDQRLVYYLGDRYRHYQARVPGYPLVGFGPLGRIRNANPLPAGTT
jgi:protein-S-isoprenylcysteine O-methyltransferase Ste14